MKKIFILLLLTTISFSQTPTPSIGTTSFSGLRLYSNGARYIADSLNRNYQIIDSMLQIAMGQAEYPELYGADSDSTTDDSQALKTAIDSAVANNSVLILTKPVYLVTDSIYKNLGDKNLFMYSPNGSKIKSTLTIANDVYYAFWAGSWINYPANGAVYSTDGTNRFTVVYADAPRRSEYILMQRTSGSTPSASDTLTKISGTGNSSYIYSARFNAQAYIPIGALHFTNGNNVMISGIEVQADTGSGFVRLQGSYLSGLVLQDLNSATLENYKGNTAAYSVVMVDDVEKFTAINSLFEHGLFAGLGIMLSKHVTLLGNEFNFNGNIPFENGYGLNIGNESGHWDITEYIFGSGNKARYNLRKGFDFHGGRKVIWDGNFVKGYVAIGIGITNIEDTVYNEDGRREYASDYVVTNNIIENDSAWFSSLSLPDPANMYSIGLQFGTFGDDDLNAGGSWNISNNIFKNYTVYNGATLETDWVIHGWGGHSKIVKVNHNAIETGSTNSAIIGLYSGNDSTTYNQIEIADVSHNTGTDLNSDYFILIGSGENLTVSSNSFQGGSVTDYGIGIMNAYGSSIDAYNLMGNLMPGLTYAKRYFIQDGLGTENKSFTDRYLSMYYDNGIRAGIGVETPEFAWDVLGNIRARYDLIAGMTGVFNGRLYLQDSLGNSGVILRSNDVSEFLHSITVTGDVNVSGVFKIAGDTKYFPSPFGTKTAANVFVANTSGGSPALQLNYVNLTIDGTTYKVLIADP